MLISFTNTYKRTTWYTLPYLLPPYTFVFMVCKGVTRCSVVYQHEIQGKT